MNTLLSPHADVVVVYSFETVDAETAQRCVANFKATRTEIERRHAGVVLEGTGEAVSPSELDGERRYRRVATGWGALD